MKDLQCSNTVKQDEGVLKLKRTITSTGCKGSVLIETTQGFHERPGLNWHLQVGQCGILDNCLGVL